MRRLRAALARFVGLLGRRASTDDFALELESHLQMHADDNERAGMPPDEARRYARVKLGGVDAVTEAYRERQGVPVVADLARDVCFGARLLARQPGFTILAVLALAIGIAANVVIFSLANALFLRPPAIADPAGVVRASSGRASNTAYDDYEAYRDDNRTLQDLAIFQLTSLSLRTTGEAMHVFGMAVSGNYFSVLGVPMTLGRPIVADDDRTGRPPVVVLSDRAWRRRFGADAGIVGRVVTLNGQAYTVVGVAPAAFDGMLAPFVPEMWVPWNGAGIFALRGRGSGHMVGRLRPDASRVEAQADLSALAASRAAGEPDADRQRSVSVYPASTLVTDFQGGAAAFVGLLFAVAGLVLVIASVNLATLLLARGAARAKEITMRLALGAGRGRVLRQLLTESLLLSGVGGCVGFTAAGVLLGLLDTRMLPTPIPVGVDLALDWRVAAFAGALCCGTTLLVGLVPALRLSSNDLVSALKGHGTPAVPQRSRLRAALVTVQVALSVVLLVVGAVLLRSMVHAGAMDRGFVADRVAVASIDLAPRGYTPEQGSRVYAQVLESVRSLPGVRAAAFTDIVPLTLSSQTLTPLGEGQPIPAPGSRDVASVLYNAVTSGYFDTMGIPLLAGRDFAATDTGSSTGVAIVNETLARTMWPGESPIGKRLRPWEGGSAGPWMEIVGLAKDSKYVTVGEEPAAFLYRPLSQSYVPIGTLLVSTVGQPLLVVPDVRARLRAIDPDLPLFGVQALASATAISLLPVQVAALLAGGLGGVALLLVALGLYGLVALLVRQRTREIGIRMALGAQPQLVVRQLARQGTRWVVLGLVAGLAIAALLVRFLGALLYGVDALDALSFAAIAVLLLAVAYLASYMPARRAVSIDPTLTLRDA